MTPFEHLSVLISIVLGLGIARLLWSVHRIAQAHERVRLYWLPLLWTVLVFVIQVEWWWASFAFRQQMSWTFFYFLFVLLSPVTLYLAAAFVLPEIEEGTRYDLERHYFRNRGWFFSLIAASTALDALRRGIEAGSATDFGTWSNGVSALLVGSLAVTESRWVHALVSLLLAGVFLTYIVTSAFQIG